MAAVDVPCPPLRPTVYLVALLHQVLLMASSGGLWCSLVLIRKLLSRLLCDLLLVYAVALQLAVVGTLDSRGRFRCWSRRTHERDCRLDLLTKAQKRDLPSFLRYWVRIASLAPVLAVVCVGFYVLVLPLLPTR